jgi:uncharacterized protein YbbC (DUF1343 family)
MIQFGIDKLLASSPAWKKQRIGFVTNDAATTNQLVSSRQALLQNGFNLVKLFSPEHGIKTSGADGSLITDQADERTQLPIVSLYNNKLKPTTLDLADIDLLLFDIPDIGCRFYTYLWTLTHLLEAAATNRIPLVVLDRPNPLSGILELVEGPMLDERNCSSFIGRWEVPLRHSCTLGELAHYFNALKNIDASIEIITCDGWAREMFHADWRIPFIPTSPAISSFESAILYPGLGLLEATNISEGRGTSKPFRLVGAPWLKHAEMASQMDDSFVHIIPEDFTPLDSKYAHQLCKGIYFEVKDPAKFRPVNFAMQFIKLAKDLHPEHFSWKPYPTMVNPTGHHHLDLLLGIPNSETLFDLPYAAFLQKANKLTQTNWADRIRSFLLYS